MKVAAIRAQGAEVVIGGARYADAQAACDRHAKESGALLVHPFDAEATIAGAGSLAIEWEEDRARFGLALLDTVLIAVGGGGLIAGVAAWWRGRVKVVGVEPEGSRCLHAALEAGHPVDVTVESVAADSLGARRVGELAFGIAREAVERVVLVNDDAIRAAQGALWTGYRIAAEPGGATALAALAAGAYQPTKGERVGVPLCGGNVDRGVWRRSLRIRRRALQRADSRARRACRHGARGRAAPLVDDPLVRRAGARDVVLGFERLAEEEAGADVVEGVLEGVAGVGGAGEVGEGLVGEASEEIGAANRKLGGEFPDGPEWLETRERIEREPCFGRGCNRPRGAPTQNTGSRGSLMLFAIAARALSSSSCGIRFSLTKRASIGSFASRQIQESGSGGSDQTRLRARKSAAMSTASALRPTSMSSWICAHATIACSSSWALSLTEGSDSRARTAVLRIRERTPRMKASASSS